MAGPSNSAELAAELASRPGHGNLRSTLVRWLLIGISLTFLGALLAAPHAGRDGGREMKRWKPRWEK